MLCEQKQVAVEGQRTEDHEGSGYEDRGARLVIASAQERDSQENAGEDEAADDKRKGERGEVLPVEMNEQGREVGIQGPVLREANPEDGLPPQLV